MRSGIPLFLVVLFVFQTVSAKTISDATAEEATGGETERIIGGKTAAKGQFPYAAALHYNDQFICTCSIISSRTVLTAAHCVVLEGKTQPADLFYAIAHVKRSASTVRIEFKSVTPHPDYDDRTIENDIAVLKTSEQLELGKEVEAVCIPHRDTDMYEYKNATAMGWGRTNRFSNEIPEDLQYIEQKIIDNSLCTWINPGINENKICAKGFTLFRGFNGICNGDSGGPLVHLYTKMPVEIGIASYINALFGCGSLAPGVFTRVAAYYDFIMEAANETDSSVCVIKANRSAAV